MKNYLKLSSLSLAIITGLSMESFAMDVPDRELNMRQVRLKKQIEDLPSGKLIELKVDVDVLLNLNRGSKFME